MADLLTGGEVISSIIILHKYRLCICIHIYEYTHMYDSIAHASVTHRARRMCRTHTGNVNCATHWHDAFLSLVICRNTSCHTHQGVMSPSSHHDLAEYMKVCETCHV